MMRPQVLHDNYTLKSHLNFVEMVQKNGIFRSLDVFFHDNKE